MYGGCVLLPHGLLFQILPEFSQNLTLDEAFVTNAQINEELKIPGGVLP